MADNSSSTVHFGEYLKVLRTRFWIIFTIFVLTVVSGWYVTDQVMAKVYSASALIRVAPRGEEAVTSFDGTGTDRPFDQTAFQSESEIMKSSKLQLPIINQLGLDKIWARTVYKGSVEKLTPQEALGYMSHVLDISFKRGTSLIEITADSQDPQEAAQIANAVADQYKLMRDADEASRSNRGSDSIRDQIAQQQKIVDDRRAIVDKLRAEAGKQGVSIDPRDNGLASRADTDLDARKRDLLTAKEDADARRVLMLSVKDLPDDQFVNTLEALGGHEIPNIATLRADAFKLEADIDNLLKQGFEENHPRVQALRAELERERQQIADLIAGTRRAIVVDSQMANSRVDLLNQEVQDLTAKTQQDQASQLGPFRDAEREYEHQESILDAYSVHLKQVIADSQLLESPVKVIARAEPPEGPSKPNKMINLIVSAVSGLSLGVLVAFLIEYLDTSVKTMADAESLLGIPVLTVIPNKGGPLPLTTQGARMPHAEGYRILRAKLDFKVQNGVGPSVSMLSGGPGEGKSTTLYNLAVVCAQAGQSVILVDGDLRRPVVHQLTKVSNERGLANYLKGEGDVLDYIQQTALPHLHVLAAGEMSISDIGTLASDKIRHMLDELKQRYDLVLVDSPPILGISDGSILARAVDYVILVIQHRRYAAEVSVRARRAIDEVHGNCVGMVLNNVASKSDDAYYYYSNYENYHKKDRKATRKKKSAAAPKANGKPEAVSARKSELESEEF
jgi:succinoglycan biosynthesis transport protein ExoP